MAHFAELDNDNRVVRINYGPDHITEEEIRARGLNVRKCSYNTKGGVHYDPVIGEPSEDQSKAYRLNYPGIGWVYDETINGFRPYGPLYSSWTLDVSKGLYVAPIPQPDDPLKIWDEELYQSDNTQGWVDKDYNQL
jgi:hypothetical protein